MDISLLIKELSRHIISVINYSRCIKAIFCPENDYVDHISEEVFIDMEIKIIIDYILYRPSAKIQFPVEVIYSWF
jgi:hypothetical protein